ncbi:DNA damage-inducible transcript 4 protein [Protopterus annectens]|uniref:DNA damage-inducible transcript 4 protein n=1 Tax=Protopterus annectens TaxID=7888 RepID=UPI001CF9F231|nr:DNA damage-inducible transcript 4 protein [Protopterus annectens]
MPALLESITSPSSFESALEEVGSHKSSWANIKQKFSTPSHCSMDTHSLSSSSSSQTDSDSLDEISLPEWDLFSDPQQQQVCSELLKVIEHCLTEAKGSLKCSKLLIPGQLLEHVGQEFLHLSATEPCGLKGALVDLCIQHESVCLHMEQISVDPTIVPTFQLTLILRLDSGLWPRIQDLFTSGPSFTPGYRHSLRLGTGFRVIKKKLYSSEELLIEEF